MVNHTAIHHEREVFDDECPETDYGNSTVEEQDGEFEWSTSKQGWILSSFFYGYVLTQVGKIMLKTLIKFQSHERLIAIESNSLSQSYDMFDCEASPLLFTCAVTLM